MEYLGKNFLWFIGVVEDRNDPLFLGRVRVRCFGWHSFNDSDEDGTPTGSLPWATTIQPVTMKSASASGLTLGTWVFGFFADGEKAQRPMVMGIIPGYNRFDPQNDESHGNPAEKPYSAVNINSKWPEDKEKGREFEPTSLIAALIGESELPRESRVEERDAQTGFEGGAALHGKYNDYWSKHHADRDNDRIEEIESYQSKWEEPPEPEDEGEGKGKYPYVQTIGTESGHIIEIVNIGGTEGARRTEYHPAGTFDEISKEGDKLLKIVGHQYTIVLKDDNIYVKGKALITVDQDVEMLVKGNFYGRVEKDTILDTKGNTTFKTGKNTLIDTVQNTTIKSGQAITMTAGTTVNIRSELGMILNSGQTMTMTSGATMAITAGSSYAMTSSGSMILSSAASIAASASGSATYIGSNTLASPENASSGVV